MTRSAAQAAASALTDRQIRSTLIGDAAIFREVLDQLPHLARSNATVLIEGETGTGKELFARAIHYLGPRAGLPFIPVNCGALTDTLLQDELFGHDRGAYTDAREARPGLLSLAQRGTLFLDEVDSLTSRAQVALLRVLQDGTFRPLGGTREQQVDLRFLAATNAPLTSLMESGTFRKDLYYRLFVHALSLPSLRDRREDILKLAEHFLHKHQQENEPAKRLAPEAAAALLSYSWPGNVRELENAIIRGIHRSQETCISTKDLALPLCVSETSFVGKTQSTSKASLKTQKKELIETFERQYLLRLLSEHSGNITRAARAAGRERRHFAKVLKKYQIDAKSFLGAAIKS